MNSSWFENTCVKNAFLRQRLQQPIEFLRGQHVFSRKLLQQDQILKDSQTLRALQLTSASSLAATHHVEVQGFAEVYLLQQELQPAPHLLGFEQQAVDGLSRTTLAQELQHGEESQVLLGHVILGQQALCPCRKHRTRICLLNPGWV